MTLFGGLAPLAFQVLWVFVLYPLGSTQAVPVTPHKYDGCPKQMKGLSQDFAVDTAAWDLPHLRVPSTVLRTMISPSMLQNRRALGNGKIIYRADFLEAIN